MIGTTLIGLKKKKTKGRKEREKENLKINRAQ
jgi:hypothetical protein